MHFASVTLERQNCLSAVLITRAIRVEPSEPRGKESQQLVAQAHQKDGSTAATLLMDLALLMAAGTSPVLCGPLGTWWLLCVCVSVVSECSMGLYQTALWISIGEENTKAEGCLHPHKVRPLVYLHSNPHSMKTLSIEQGWESTESLCQTTYKKGLFTDYSEHQCFITFLWWRPKVSRRIPETLSSCRMKEDGIRNALTYIQGNANCTRQL